ncbi:hypothetical protein Tco_0351260 [Tanacetum coccineum]
MSRTNSQAEIVFEEQLVPRANRLIIKKNNQRGIIYSADLYFASLIWDEFEWKIVERSCRPSMMSKLLYTRFTKLIINYILSHNKSIYHKSDSKLHSSQDDHPITKLLSTTNGEFMFGMEVSDAMISYSIKKKAGYKYYMAKKMESKKAKIVDKPEEQHISPIKSRKGKGFICYDDQVENVPNKLKKDVVPRKTRSLTIAEKVVVDKYNKCGQKLKGPTVDDPTAQSLLDLWKGSKASRLKSLRQKKQPVTGEESSPAHNKYYASSDIDSDTTHYSSSSDESGESANETDDADQSDMDLSDDKTDRDDDVAGYGVFMHNKSTVTPNSTYLNFMSHPVYTDAQTTSVVHSPDVNPKLTGYISGNVPRRECSSYTISTSKENSLSYNNSLTKLTQSQSKEADAKGEKEYEEDQLQEGNIDKNENHILGPSTFAITKKFKELIQKDELTIADLEGAGLKRLKVQYNNDVEVEYHKRSITLLSLSIMLQNNTKKVLRIRSLKDGAKKFVAVTLKLLMVFTIGKRTELISSKQE